MSSNSKTNNIKKSKKLINVPNTFCNYLYLSKKDTLLLINVLISHYTSFKKEILKDKEKNKFYFFTFNSIFYENKVDLLIKIISDDNIFNHILFNFNINKNISLKYFLSMSNSKLKIIFNNIDKINYIKLTTKLIKRIEYNKISFINKKIISIRKNRSLSCALFRNIDILTTNDINGVIIMGYIKKYQIGFLANFDIEDLEIDIKTVNMKNFNEKTIKFSKTSLQKRSIELILGDLSKYCYTEKFIKFKLEISIFAQIKYLEYIMRFINIIYLIDEQLKSNYIFDIQIKMGDILEDKHKRLSLNLENGYISKDNIVNI